MKISKELLACVERAINAVHRTNMPEGWYNGDAEAAIIAVKTFKKKDKLNA